MDGEVDFTQVLVERFTAYHRRDCLRAGISRAGGWVSHAVRSLGSYVCKAGLGDVMLGAAATIADYNGVAKASHIKESFVNSAQKPASPKRAVACCYLTGQVGGDSLSQ